MILRLRSSAGGGVWSGHSLCFDVAGDTTVFDLHFFRAGEIGLEDKNGVRILYSKQATNVIPLHRRRAADSDGSA